MIPDVTVTPYGAGIGRLVTAPAGMRLEALPAERVMALVAEHGFLIFRGFGPTLQDYSAFVRRHSDHVTLDPARTFHGGSVAQKVDAGVEALGLHVENGNSPFVPTLTWFLCEKAAATGSQTTVCDGHRAWAALSEETRRALTEQDIVFTRSVSEKMWKTFVQHQLAVPRSQDDITVDDLRELATGHGHTRFTLHQDGAITYAYRTAAAHPTLFGERLAFANSILGPSYNYEPPKITFADGRDVPAELLAEIAEVTESVTEEIDWMDGDVVMVDNTRTMHGRRAVLDTNRSIYNSQSYAAQHLVEAVTGARSTRLLSGTSELLLAEAAMV